MRNRREVQQRPRRRRSSHGAETERRQKKRDVWAGKQRLIEGTFPGAINRGGAVRPRRAQQQTDRSRRPRSVGRSRGLARDTRQVPERFTLEAKVSADGDQPTASHVAPNGRTNTRLARLRFSARLVTTNATESRCGHYAELVPCPLRSAGRTATRTDSLSMTAKPARYWRGA